MDNLISKTEAPHSIDQHFQEVMRRMRAPMAPEGASLLVQQPSMQKSANSKMLLLVIVLHVVAIYLLTQKQRITPPALASNQPMLVSIITPQPEAPATVPVIVPVKPVLKTPLTQKKVAIQKPREEVKPVTEEASTLAQSSQMQEVAKEKTNESVPSTPIAASAEAVENKAPAKAEPVVEEKIEPPKFGVAYLNNPAPAYPSLSRRMGEEGRAVLKVLVSENGEAVEVQLEKSSGSERLDQAAIDAVKNWRFLPAKKGNHALSAYVLVPIKFSLNG